MDRPALSFALGWPENRWKNMESPTPWGENYMEWVREGMAALVARTTLPEECGPKAAAFVLGETTKKPWSSPPVWREGECPVSRPRGRPRGRGASALSSSAARRAAENLAQSFVASAPDDHEDGPPDPPAPPGVAHSMRDVEDAQAKVVLKLLAGGKIDVAAASMAISDVYRSGHLSSKSAGLLPASA